MVKKSAQNNDRIITHEKEVLKELSKESQKTSNFILDAYLKYGK